MSAQQWMLTAWIVLTLPLAMLGDPAATNLPPRAALTLADGSRVLGIPRLTSIPFQTAYAKIDLPLKQVQSIKVEADHETVAVALTNGDRLNGTLQLKPIELETLFGQVKIDFTLIAGISVYQGGKGSLPGILQDGLVLHYSFDEDEGGKVTDASGKGNDGKVKGATWTPQGKVGGAYSFDGNNGIDAGNGASLQLSSDYTLSAWAYPTIWEAGRILNKGDRYNNSQKALVLDIGNGARFIINGNGGLSTGSGTLNAWNLLTATYHDHRMSLYVNGRLVSEGAGVDANVVSQHLNIGTLDFNSDSAFHGTIDEVMIFNRALSEEEVKALYNAQN